MDKPIPGDYGFKRRMTIPINDQDSYIIAIDKPVSIHVDPTGN